MSRKKHRIERFIMPDVVYGDTGISKFINYIMLQGKKTIAEKLFYDAMKMLEETEGKKRNMTVVQMFYHVVNILKPSYRLAPRRVGGATYRIPVSIQDYAAFAVSCKTIISVARSKRSREFSIALFNVFRDVLNGEGDALKKKNETEKAIESSKAFSNMSYN